MSELVEPDAASAVLLQWAVVAADLFKALIAQGVPEQLASDLTYTWMTNDADDDD